MRVRPCADPSDTTAMQQLASRLWPRGPHAGGLGWGLGAEPVVGMFRDAGPDGAVPPGGYRIRSAGDGEPGARRGAPSGVAAGHAPWPAEVPPTVSPEATSRFTASHYEQALRP